MKVYRYVALFAVAAFVLFSKDMPTLWAAEPQPTSAAALPSDSIYQLALPLTDQRGKRQALGAARGRARIVAMFYATCGYVCPLTIETLKRIEAELSTVERARLGILLVTLDPKRDSVAALKQLADSRQIDSARWTLARTDTPADVRKLAAVLGVQYRQLANGEFNHSTLLTLLDSEGRPLARSDKLGTLDREFVAHTRQAMSASNAKASHR